EFPVNPGTSTHRTLPSSPSGSEQNSAKRLFDFSSKLGRRSVEPAPETRSNVAVLPPPGPQTPPSLPPEDLELPEVRRLMHSALRWIETPPDSDDPELVRQLVSRVHRFALSGRPSRRFGTEEQRRAVRLPCEQAASLKHAGGTDAARIRDISLIGLRLELSTELEARSIVEVDGMHCEVRWCARLTENGPWNAGVAFLEPPAVLVDSWVAELLHRLGFNEEYIHQSRNSIRVEAALPVDVRGVGTAVTRDLGVGGCLLESPAELPDSQLFDLSIGPLQEMEPLRLTGKVMSARRDRTRDVWLCSLRFADPTPAQVRLVGRYVLSLLADPA
ncbi:MAG: PilZ domain-containing protein, partial [Candidatus Eremiobacterota bacterium]